MKAIAIDATKSALAKLHVFNYTNAPTQPKRVKERIMESKRFFLTTIELAELFSISKSTVYRLITDGEIRAIRVGDSIRIPIEAVDEFIKTNQTKGAISA